MHNLPGEYIFKENALVIANTNQYHIVQYLYLVVISCSCTMYMTIIWRPAYKVGGKSIYQEYILNNMGLKEKYDIKKT